MLRRVDKKAVCEVPPQYQEQYFVVLGDYLVSHEEIVGFFAALVRSVALGEA